MKAAVYRRYGGPERLEWTDRPMPVPGPDELLVRVAATSINPIDFKLMSGTYRLFLPVERPAVPCHDVAGVVVGRGDQVRAWPDGSRIIARVRSSPGACAAEYTTVHADLVAQWPDALDAAEAASLPLAGLTALGALRDGGLESGSKVLVVGAAGGVGHLAVQLAREAGASVTAVASDDARGFLAELGITDVLDRSATEWGGPYTLILDSPCKAPWGRIKRALTQRGRYMALTPTPALLARAQLPGSRVKPWFLTPDGANLQRLADRVQAETLRVCVQRRFPLEQAAEAFRYAMTPGRRGKVALVSPNADAPSSAR